LLRSRLGDERLWRTNLFLNRVVLSWDAVNAAWDRWVLAFGPDAQTDLLLSLGFRTPDLFQLLMLCFAAATLCMAALILAMRRQYRPGGDRASRHYAKACQRVGRIVRPRLASESPETFSQVIGASRPDLGADIDKITMLYLRLRYLAAHDPALESELARHVRQFRPGRARRTGAMRRQQTGSG
jgi:protein-glutamine gamma-glutamyltransferase